jgi:hypothetical protein
VASNWRDVDAITLSYCNSVAKVLKERHVELVNKFRLLPQCPKEQQKKKESTKPTTITTTAATTPVVTKTMTPPFAGANINSSCQQKHQSLVDMHINNIISPVLMLKQPAKEGTTPRSLYNIHDMDRASATITPLANIFDEIMSTSASEQKRHQAYNKLEHENTLSLMSALDGRPNATASPYAHAQDNSPLLNWESNSEPYDEDVVDITDCEVYEVLGLLNDESSSG